MPVGNLSFVQTTTTPAGKNIHGAKTFKKNLFEIMAAHEIAYAATASVGYPQDYIDKINKAKHTKGTSFIHVYATCPTGWGIPTEIAIQIAKEAVDSGLFYLAEYQNREFKLNKNPKSFFSAKDYLLKQGRFKHLTDNDINIIEKQRDEKWEYMRTHWK